MSAKPFSELTALERAAALVDAGTLDVLPGETTGVVAARGSGASQRCAIGTPRSSRCGRASWAPSLRASAAGCSKY
jgi:hypothetical protein